MNDEKFSQCFSDYTKCKNIEFIPINFFPKNLISESDVVLFTMN